MPRPAPARKPGGAQLLAEPRTSRGPRALDGLAREANCLRCLVEREPRENPAFDDAIGTLIHLGQAFERHVDGQHLLDLSVVQERHVPSRIERDRSLLAAALAASARSGVIHQDSAHGVRGDRQEAVAVGRGDLAPLQEPQIGLVDEGRGRRVTRGLAAELPPRNLPQLVVHKRGEALEGLAIAVAPAHEPVGDLTTGHDRPNRMGVGGHHTADVHLGPR